MMMLREPRAGIDRMTSHGIRHQHLIAQLIVKYPLIG